MTPANEAPAPRRYNSAVAALALGVSRAMVERWLARNYLPSERAECGCWMVSPRHLAAHVAGNRALRDSLPCRLAVIRRRIGTDRTPGGGPRLERALACALAVAAELERLKELKE